MPDDAFTVRDLRRRWKPTKERLNADGEHEAVRIRLHRCLSWVERAGSCAEGESPSLDTALILQWTALNALYGRWNAERREPVPDKPSLYDFITLVMKADADNRVGGALEEHRRLVLTILKDEYLSRYFWEDPTEERARKSQKAAFDAPTWYYEQRYERILQRLLERIYLARCQLVHGAATHGSRLNRSAVRRCSTMLGHLLTAFALVIIDHAWHEDWDGLCFPPKGG